MQRLTLGDNIEVTTHREQEIGVGKELDMPSQTARGFAYTFSHYPLLAIGRSNEQQAIRFREITTAKDQCLSSINALAHIISALLPHLVTQNKHLWHAQVQALRGGR